MAPDDNRIGSQRGGQAGLPTNASGKNLIFGTRSIGQLGVESGGLDGVAFMPRSAVVFIRLFCSLVSEKPHLLEAICASSWLAAQALVKRR